MTRLAEGRSTHLERSEIAAETLRLFDQGSDPSIRQLAKELAVTPSAIYHHFESRTEIVKAAVDLVWQEILTNIFNAVGDPFQADPLEVMLATGVATRHGFADHYAMAPYMAAVPESDELTAGALGMFANVFERYGIKGERAADAFHAYASYVFGTSLFNANRIAARAEMEATKRESRGADRFRSRTPDELAGQSDAETRSALDSVVDLSVFDPDKDEVLFKHGLQRLMESLKQST
ncbi:MAG: TetR/AcrR family transcriptional regulator [Actinomycetota bacterium]|nr:TetR/AcrR family transcriptional regulator [Actinomycetota bacterium]